MNACGLALSQITYLIASLTKKNNKSSIVELKQLVERHGEEAEKHLLFTLFSQVEFSSDGKSTGKDFHQVYFFQECYFYHKKILSLLYI